ncbi:uncharacterized protein L969DRAFT_51010 [Mixia osmundae IAM 14324]|uniref:uncharacterized protein n=1 Tax=Mixia osmundae (strain CBS 9802 / IAM 14324 / JCM 22182 / KY 12970) TaxID=764103 RepID=UPI0004A54932|nr:uncharacterized protein L969DRAFT_51010 [Mixia osmundae IAM 14324]KEI38226.1 hypothetical protein L969DRAFT_51010 [Mixia osmundae IAM 14324]
MRFIILGAASVLALVAATPLNELQRRQASSASSSALTSSASSVSAKPSASRGKAGITVGSSSVAVYPPTATSDYATYFPSESVVGYAGPTPTGGEAYIAQTAPAYPSFTAYGALLTPQDSTKGQDGFNPIRYLGNLSPYQSIDSAVYGLPNASSKVPGSCYLQQVHVLFRHGSRAPTGGAPPAAFAALLANATVNGTGFTATGPLAFLNTWTYKLASQILSVWGRQQEYDLGAQLRIAYGSILSNFTLTNTLPVLRTPSQDRMYKSTLNLAAGFFGLPADPQYHLSIVIEQPGFNSSLSSYETCPNSNNKRGSVGTTASTNFTNAFGAPIAKRLQQYITGIEINATTVSQMLNLCAYETINLGYSSFCDLFTSQDFKDFEHAFDISFAGNNLFQSPVSAAQGLGYLQEFQARLSHVQPTFSNSSSNQTLNGSPITFPVNNTLYMDATHEVIVADVLTALNFTVLSEAPPTAAGSTSNATFVASRVLPMGTHIVFQVANCSNESTTGKEGTFVRAILNDAVIPWGLTGCPKQKDGFCELSVLIRGLSLRNQQIDFDYACNGNYSIPSYGQIKNGLPPLMSSAAASSSSVRSSSASATSTSSA